MRSPSQFMHSGYKPATLAGLAPYTHWLLRIGLASVYLYHGLGKFMGAGVGGFAEMMGLPIFVAFLVAIAEVSAASASWRGLSWAV